MKKNRKIAYYERPSLRVAGQTDQAEPVEPSKTLLVADDVIICKWTSSHTPYGCYRNYLRPAIYDGEKCFLRTKTWDPAPGYSACGTDDVIVSFARGSEILLKNNAYEWMWSSPTKA